MQSQSKFDKLIETFKKSSEEAIRKCASESEKLRVLIVDSGHAFSKLILPEKLRISLTEVRIFELQRLTVHILYLALNGLYRNAFDVIRYIFESAIQSIYIDSRHPISGLRTRIEILKEVEDKREYRAANLIDKLEIDSKKYTLKKEYKRLSQIIHPSHRSIIEVLGAIRAQQIISPPSCKEISEICESMKIVLDMILFLYISCTPEKRKEKLLKDSDLVKYSKKYNLILLSKLLKE